MRRLTGPIWAPGEKKLQQVWLTLKRGGGTAAASVAAGSPFVIRLEVRPPHGREPVWGAWSRGSSMAWYARSKHIPTRQSDVAARLDFSGECRGGAAHLVDQRMAVPRLVAPYRRSVKRDPTDHLCVARELLAAEPINQNWSIKGEIVEVSR